MSNFNIQNIGIKLINARKEAGFSQTAIGKYLGVDQSLISKYETGERSITMDSLYKLSDLYGCSLDYFLKKDSRNIELKSVALRGSKIEGNDLEVIARINRILVNLQEMEGLLTEDM